MQMKHENSSPSSSSSTLSSFAGGFVCPRLSSLDAACLHLSISRPTVTWAGLGTIKCTGSIRSGTGAGAGAGGGAGAGAGGGVSVAPSDLLSSVVVVTEPTDCCCSLVMLSQLLARRKAGSDFPACLSLLEPSEISRLTAFGRSSVDEIDASRESWGVGFSIEAILEVYEPQLGQKRCSVKHSIWTQFTSKAPREKA